MLRKEDKASLKVLVVDSDEFNVRVADSFLYACGYPNLVVARNPKEALEHFTDGIRLILLNINLAGCSGLEVCKRLRQMPRGKSVPIVAFVPKGKGIKTQCFKVGVSDVIVTPTSFKGFKRVLQRNL